jgi:hypothetical protein
VVGGPVQQTGTPLKATVQCAISRYNADTQQQHAHPANTPACSRCCSPPPSTAWIMFQVCRLVLASSTPLAYLPPLASRCSMH